MQHMSHYIHALTILCSLENVKLGLENNLWKSIRALQNGDTSICELDDLYQMLYQYTSKYTHLSSLSMAAWS